MKSRLFALTLPIFLFAACGVVSPTPTQEIVKMTPTLETRDGFYQDVPYGADPAQMMDIFYPVEQKTSMPVVVYVHGGGWVEGDKSSPEAADYIDELLNRGYVVFSLNYRLAPEFPFPAQIQDVKSALRSIRARAVEFRIDPEHIGIFGSSAGGHLSALAGVTSEEDGFDTGENLDRSGRVNAVVDLFGPADINQITVYGLDPAIAQTFGRHESPSEEYRLASPTTYAGQDDPPFLIIHGDLDRVVPISQSRLLNETLQQARVTSELLVVKNGVHGFSDNEPKIAPSNAEIIRRIADFFDRYLK